jgi:hypothetical protein
MRPLEAATSKGDFLRAWTKPVFLVSLSNAQGKLSGAVLLLANRGQAVAPAARLSALLDIYLPVPNLINVK